VRAPRTVDEAHITTSLFLDVMNHASFNYVRTYRQRHCFTEDELAFLVSHRSHTRISRIEIGRAVPSLAVGLALEVLFRQTPRQMFPGLYEAVEDEVMRRAKSFLDDLEGRNDRRSHAKRELLEGLARPAPSEGHI
jgi:DNA-binding XRE family transcriptional regulator